MFKFRFHVGSLGLVYSAGEPLCYDDSLGDPLDRFDCIRNM